MAKSTRNWILILTGNAIALSLVFHWQNKNFSTISSSVVDIAANRPPTTAHNVAMPLSAFDQITQTVYSHDVCKYGQASVAPASKQFDLNEWRQHATSGGLDDKDRVMLAKYYGSADSVFEWGLGESSYMAGYFNVSRYAGVDSDAEWVSNARDNTPSHFRLSFADIGSVHNFGRPRFHLRKNQYNYVIAPLVTEHCPFDVYLVDGRFRVACAIMAILHASRGNHQATILMHDFESIHKVHASYKEILRVCDKVEFSGSKLVALKRKKDVTDEMLLEMYFEFGSNSA